MILEVQIAYNKQLYNTILFFFFNDTATTEIYTLSLHDALPICPHTGLDPQVRDYVLEQEATKRFMDRLQELLEVALPGYVREGKQYLTIAIGCTGGKHRSVVLSEELRAWLQ